MTHTFTFIRNVNVIPNRVGRPANVWKMFRGSSFSAGVEHKQQLDKLIKDWQPFSDVWSLKYSTVILGGFGSFTGLLVTNHLRTMTRMGRVLRLSTYAPPVYIGVFTGLSHYVFIQLPLISHRYECSLCLYTRSAVIQAFTGLVLPTTLSAACVAYFCNRTNTYAFADLMFRRWSSLKININIIKGLIQKRKGDRKIAALLLVNVLLGYFLPFHQQYSLYIVGDRLAAEGKDPINYSWDAVNVINKT